MNSRERFLITVLVAVVILLGGFKFLIEPELKSFANVKSEYGNALLDKQAAQSNMLRKDSIYKENQKLEESALKMVETFFPELKNDEIQLFFNDISKNVGISYGSFTMTAPVAAQISNPIVQQNSLSYPLKEKASEIESINNKDKSTTSTDQSKTGTTAPLSTNAASSQNAPSDTVEMMSVSMQFTDSYNKAMNFIDAIKASGKTVRVSSVTLATMDGGTVSASVTAECFGVKKVTANKATAG